MTAAVSRINVGDCAVLTVNVGIPDHHAAALKWVHRFNDVDAVVKRYVDFCTRNGYTLLRVYTYGNVNMGDDYPYCPYIRAVAIKNNRVHRFYALTGNIYNAGKTSSIEKSRAIRPTHGADIMNFAQIA